MARSVLREALASSKVNDAYDPSAIAYMETSELVAALASRQSDGVCACCSFGPLNAFRTLQTPACVCERG
jgi:hypothetical protein